MMIGARDRGLGKLYTIVIIGLLGSETVGQALNPVKKPQYRGSPNSFVLGNALIRTLNSSSRCSP